MHTLILIILNIKKKHEFWCGRLAKKKDCAVLDPKQTISYNVDQTVIESRLTIRVTECGDCLKTLNLKGLKIFEQTS